MNDSSHDPYAPPRSDVNQAPTARPTGTVPNYFVWPAPWVLVLTIATLGFFSIYWHYRQWLAVKASGERINAIGRGIFGVFFLHALFRQIQGSRTQAGLPRGRAESGLATTYVILTILSNLAARSGSPLGLALSLLMGLGGAFILSTAQNDINQLAKQTSSETNGHLGVGGGIMIAVGLAFFLKMVILLLG
jgi:hypothetical protein